MRGPNGGRIVGRRDPYAAYRCVAQLGHRLDFGLDFLEPRFRNAYQAFTRCRPNASCGAREQPHSEPRFELANGLAKHGLQNAEPSRRFGEAGFPSDGDQSCIPQVSPTQKKVLTTAMRARSVAFA